MLAYLGSLCSLHQKFRTAPEPLVAAGFWPPGCSFPGVASANSVLGCAFALPVYELGPILSRGQLAACLWFCTQISPVQALQNSNLCAAML